MSPKSKPKIRRKTSRIVYQCPHTFVETNHGWHEQYTNGDLGPAYSSLEGVVNATFHSANMLAAAFYDEA